MYKWKSNEGKTLPSLLLGAQVTVSDEEVRVWICENGMSVFRLKVLGGDIHLSEYAGGKQVEVMIVPKKEEKK